MQLFLIDIISFSTGMNLIQEQFLRISIAELPIRLSEYPADRLDAKRWNLTISAYKGIQYTHEEPYIFLGRSPFITFEEEQKTVSLDV